MFNDIKIFVVNIAINIIGNFLAKRATKLHFLYYLCVVVILFNPVYTSLHFLPILLEN